MPGAAGAAVLGLGLVVVPCSAELVPAAAVVEGVEGAELAASLSGQLGALQQIAQHLTQGSSHLPCSLACRYYTAAGPSSPVERLAPGALGFVVGECVAAPFAAFVDWQL